MWQTLLNAFTFHDDFAVRVLSGRLRPGNARGRLSVRDRRRGLVVAALPVALVSLPLELAAVALRRGGLLEAEVRELPPSTGCRRRAARSALRQRQQQHPRRVLARRGRSPG